ncbi:hypothetical protein BD560DRAFT_404096 [Blakeslea trispora]|nr:hypothetical protein BD560DRAFT_404096 [Blakeslea trispora]
MNLPQPTPSTSLSMKRNKKPKPLFGIFRKGKEDNNAMIMPTPSKSQPLGSGLAASSIPLNSIQQRLDDPYSTQQNKQSDHAIYKNPLFSPQYAPPQYYQPQQRRQRSKSVGRDSSPNTSRLMEERENALYKLCGNSPDSTSLVDSLPLLSPTYNKAIPPPVPPIPLQHQLQSPTTEPSRPAVRKYPSAHDIRKAAKLQQDSIQQASAEKMPTQHKVQPRPSPNMTRSRSASTSTHRRKPSPPPVMSPPLLPKQAIRHPLPVQHNDDDDDDVPLGFLQSPISKPSSLLSDQDDEDDNDLVPIAVLTVSNSKQAVVKDKDYQTAADKYKERVKERLHLDKEEDEEGNDDDDIPISLALLSFKDRIARKQ